MSHLILNQYTVLGKQSVQQMKIKPNMTHYNKAYAQFDWRDIESELDWFPGWGLNKAYECIDRHCLHGKADKTAMIWEGLTGENEYYTFDDVRKESNKVANVLTELDVQKGDRVFIFLPRIPELYISLIGILKVGGVVGTLFSAFGPDALYDRLSDSGAKVLITSPDLKDRIDQIKGNLPRLEHIIIVKHREERDKLLEENEHIYKDLMAQASDVYKMVETSKDDYSIMHYTSGTTGKPKGAVHKHYALLAHYMTGRYVLDFKEDDIYWCTADPGWVTGTSYGVFAPWSCGIPILIMEKGFNADEWYKFVAKHKVSIFYTAPTAIRMLMKAGDDIPKRHNLSSLRHILSVGEPLNPEAIVWGQNVFHGLAFHDTWWQTETGAMQIVNFPCLDVKLGSMGKPLPGTVAGILDEEFNELPEGEEGLLALRPGFPSMFVNYLNKEEMYRSKFKNGWYITGDRARKDQDGYYWFIGRDDDVINSAGHLIGPFEVESALIEHESVAEAAVIGIPDPERHEIVKAFVSLKEGYAPSVILLDNIKDFVRHRLSAHAYPREIQFLESLPKTRSGKIMRRLLKARELGLPEGDTSTLED